MLTTWQEWPCGSASTSTNSRPRGAGPTPDHPPWAGSWLRAAGRQCGPWRRRASRSPLPPPKVLRCCCSSSRWRPGALPPQAPHAVAPRVTLHGPHGSPGRPLLLFLTRSPASCRLGRVPGAGSAPLCCVLFLEQAEPLRRRVLCSSVLARGQPPPPLPGWGFKATGQCKLGFVSLAQRGCCCSLRKVSDSSEPPVLRAEAASLSKGLQPWSLAPQTEGSLSRSQDQMCVLN